MKSNYFKEWFSFSRSEKNGILVLLVLIFIFSMLHVFKGYFSEETVTDFTEFENQIAKQQMDIRNGQANNRSVTEDSLILFTFDPNTVSADEFEKLGFSKKNAETLLKYRKSNGHFDKKEDFRKLFFVDDSIYSVLAPYIVIEKSEEKQKEKTTENSYTKNSEKKDVLYIELNSADSATLDKLSGIGPSYAARIIKYRDKLGGYYSTSQLMEVYGFTSEQYCKIKDNVYVSPDLIKKINVNKAEFKELIRHPYLNKLKVIKILDFRKVMTRINSVDELVKNKILDPGDSEKLIWYFEFD